MATNAQFEDPPDKDDDEEQKSGGTPTTKQKEDELEEGELIDDDDDDDDDNVDEENKTGPPYDEIGARDGPSSAGPVQKLNIRCRFYSKIVSKNKCTWGDQCRFEHRDESPEPGEAFDPRGLPVANRRPLGPNLPPMGPAERPYPPFANRNQPMLPHGYGQYDPYCPPQPQNHQSQPLPQHFMQHHHWREPMIYYPSPPPGSAHLPFESLSSPAAGPSSHVVMALPNTGPPTGGAPPGAYPPASSAAHERRTRLAYEFAPWNDRGGNYPANRYDRGDPAAGARGIFYRNHYNRDSYGRDHPGPPPYHMVGVGPSNYSNRGGPMGPHPSHFRYMSSSHGTSNKRGHDEDESSWSDSGSEDSILGQASCNDKSHASKANKKPHYQSNHHPSPRQQEASSAALPSDANLNDYPLDQGSGTPPGEPLPEDKERQEKLLNKLKQIEDMMAEQKAKQEQEDSV